MLVMATRTYGTSSEHNPVSSLRAITNLFDADVFHNLEAGAKRVWARHDPVHIFEHVPVILHSDCVTVNTTLKATEYLSAFVSPVTYNDGKNACYGD